MKTTMTATEFRRDIYNLMNEASVTHKPITITGKNSSGIYLSMDDWSAIQETLELLSIPGMRDSIKQGINTPLTDCSDELEW